MSQQDAERRLVTNIRHLADGVALVSDAGLRSAIYTIRQAIAADPSLMGAFRPAAFTVSPPETQPANTAHHSEGAKHLPCAEAVSPIHSLRDLVSCETHSAAADRAGK